MRLELSRNRPGARMMFHRVSVLRTSVGWSMCLHEVDCWISCDQRLFSSVSFVFRMNLRGSPSEGSSPEASRAARAFFQMSGAAVVEYCAVFSNVKGMLVTWQFIICTRSPRHTGSTVQSKKAALPAKTGNKNWGGVPGDCNALIGCPLRIRGIIGPL